MKTQKIKVAILLIAITALTCYATKLVAQSGVWVQSSIDTKILINGDEKRGFKKGTIDASFRLMMESNPQRLGYVIVFPEFVYRNTEGNLKMHTANFGYTFNTIIPRSEISLSGGYGWIDHYSKTNFCFVFTQSYAFKINDKLKAVIVSDFRERSDLKRLYPSADSDDFKWSLRVGFEVKL